MWSLFNKTKIEEVQFPGFSWLKRDIHNHLIPGLDDGSPDVDTSISLIRKLSEAGIKNFVCTPHVIEDMYRNTPETVHGGRDKLREAIKKEGLDVRISAGAEYLLDEYFISVLHTKKPLLNIYGNYVLTELPWAIPPTNVESMVFELSIANYQPILAHPERYGYYHNKLEKYIYLKELGFSLQMNLLSLTGYYGKKVESVAKFLLKEGLISYVGSDLHHEDHLKMLTAPSSIRIFEKYLAHKVWNDFESEEKND